MKNKKKDLYVPVHVPDRNELIPGFGTVELTICGAAVAVAAIVAIVMYIAGINIIYSVGAAICIITFVILIFRKDRYGENLIFKTQYVMRFRTSQKKYLYQYHNIYEGGNKK